VSKVLLSLSVALALVFLGHSASAALLPDGSIVWSFEGHGVGIQNGESYAIAGDMTFSGSGLVIDASVDGVEHALSAGIDPVIFEDGALNSADRLSSSLAATLFVTAPFILAAPSVYARSGAIRLNFLDNDGTVFNDLVANGSFLEAPADAPDASLFEVREIGILQTFCTDTMDSLCSDGGGQLGIVPELTITVDAFHEPAPAPEAGAAALLATALAALLLARRSGIHSEP
jgi:hypothetical protein